MMPVDALDLTGALPEAAVVYLQHRVAIEHARTTAGKYLSNLWDAAPARILEAEGGLRFPWSYKGEFLTREGEAGRRAIDLWYERSVEVASIVPQATIRLGDARFFTISGTEVTAVLGAWSTGDCEKLKKRLPRAVDRLKGELRTVADVGEPHEKWELVRVTWALEFRSLDADVALVAGRARRVTAIFERFIAGEFGGS